ncbi:MAG TPA: hypothetical protein VHF89_16955 [Solirubrobacteraceae bacterium]|nr:hypothetical protein [Solirubrobacteraceae bacterium]
MARCALLLLALAAPLAAGCGTSDDRDEARAAVERFYAAVRDDDAEAACEQLGDPTLAQLESQSGRPCESVITRLEYDGGAVARTQVFITNAKVDLRSGESAFLSREDDGWKLSAIGCRAEKGKPADRPFECEVES